MSSVRPLLAEVAGAAAIPLGALLRDQGFTRDPNRSRMLEHPSGVVLAITENGYRISFPVDGTMAVINQNLATPYKVVAAIATAQAKHLAEAKQ